MTGNEKKIVASAYFEPQQLNITVSDDTPATNPGRETFELAVKKGGEATISNHMGSSFLSTRNLDELIAKLQKASELAKKELGY